MHLGNSKYTLPEIGVDGLISLENGKIVFMWVYNRDYFDIGDISFILSINLDYFNIAVDVNGLTGFIVLFL